MSDKTPKTGMPLLFPGQAQKEITHNEALILIDALLSPVAEGLAAQEPAGLVEADAGKCWLVADGATGGFSGQDGRLAIWTGEFWRFSLIPEHFRIFRRDLMQESLEDENGWYVAAAVADPAGGSVVDVEARDTLAAILSILRSRRLIPV